MNEALNSLYNDLKNSGFKGTPEQFKNLMMTDSEARNQVYNDLKSSGFVGTQDQFHELIGFGQQPAPQVKKKADMVSPSAATSSVSPLGKPTNAFQERLQADRLGREVSMRPVETAAPKQALSVGGAVKPETPEQIIEKAKPQPQDVYLNKALSTINEDLVGSNEEYVVPKLNYQFGDYGFNFEEAGPMRDRVKVTAPNGKVEEFSLDNFLSSSDQGVASELQKFISNNQVASKAIEARAKSLESSKFSEDKDVTNAINGLNTETNTFKRELDAFVLAQKELEAQGKAFQNMDAAQLQANSGLYEKYLQNVRQLKSKEVEISKKEQELSRKSNKLTSDIGAYTAMKSEQGTALGSLYNSVLNGVGGIIGGFARTAATAYGYSMPGGEYALNAAVKKGEFQKPKEMISKYLSDETTTKEYIQDVKDKSFVGGALLGLAESAPAMLLGPLSLPALISQGSDAAYQELDKLPDDMNVSEWEKALFASTIGGIAGYLENKGLSNAIGAKGLLNNLAAKFFVNGAIRKGATSFTGKAFEEFINENVESLISRGILRVTAAGLAEAETGALQELGDIGVKEVFNAIKGNDVFQTPESASEFALQVLEAGASEAVGGLVIGTLSASSKAYSENKFDKMLDNQVKFMSAIKDDPTYVDAFNAKMNQDAVNGIITEEEAEKNKNNLQQSMGLFKQIPDNISTEGQKKALGLLIERKKLEDARQGKDPDLVIKETNRINEIKQELQKISEDYAVQESSTEEAGSIPSDIEFVNSLDDDSINIINAKSLDEIPEQFRDRAVEKKETPVKVRKKILGLPIGPETNTVVNQGYYYTLTGKEIKDYAVQESSTEETTAGNRTFDDIKNEYLKSELDSFKKNYEDDIDYFESKLSDRQSEFDKKNPIARFFSNRPVKSRNAEFYKERLELLNKNPEKYLEEEISYLEESYKKENNSDVKNSLDYFKNLLTKLKEDYAVQESSTEESVLRTEQPEMGLQEVGERNTQVEATPQEVVAQEEVTPAEVVSTTETTTPIIKRDEIRSLTDEQIAPLYDEIPMNLLPMSEDVSNHDAVYDAYYRAKKSGKHPELVSKVEEIITPTPNATEVTIETATPTTAAPAEVSAPTTEATAEFSEEPSNNVFNSSNPINTIKSIELEVQPQMSTNDLSRIINDAIKAKLSKAQIVDILVKRGGLTDAESNQAYNDVKAGNAISFTTTGTTPAATTTTVKPGAKYIAAISDAINNLAGGNLSPEVKDSIIKSIKDARTAIKNTLAAERAIRKEVASAINDLVSKGDLTQKQAAAILKRFASVDMFNDAAIDKFITNTFSVFERSANKAIANKRNSLLSSIKSLVAKSAKQPKTSTGKARSGSLDSQGQSFFKAVKEILTAALNNDINKMSELAAELSNQQEINDAIDKEIRGEKLTTKEAELLDKVYAFDTFGDILNMSEQELETFLDDFKTAKASSIVQLKRQRAEWVAERKLLHEKAAMSVKDNAPNLYDNGRLMNDNEIIAKKREIWQSFQKMHVWEGLKKVYDNMDLFGINFVGRWLRKSLSNLETLLLTIESNGNKFFTDNILKPLKDFYEVHQRGIHDQYDKLSEIANTIPGIKGGYKEIKKLLSKGVVTIKMMDGKNSAFNADELLSIYCLSKNDVQREKLLKSGIGPIQLAEIKGILGDKVIQFGDKVVDYLSNEYYESVNDIYSNVNYTNLPKVENYFPTKSLSPSASAQALYSGDFSSIFNSETASALKERTDDSSPIQLHRAFTDVMSSHIDTMERYKAYAEGTKRINAIFESKDFNTLMEVTGTKKMIRYLTNLSINPNINIPSGETGFSKLLDKFSGFALAFKLSQLPRQATSVANAFEEYQFSKKRKIASLDLLMFVLDNAYTIATLPKQIAKAYNMSAGVKSRIDQALEGGFHKIESGARVSSATKKLRSDSEYEKGKKILRVIAQSPTVLGDILGIMGYMTNYNRDIANGMSEEDALKKFNEYNVTAQTKRDVDKIPLQQSEHGLNRVFTMFGSTGWLQLNKVMQSATNIRRASFKYAKTRNSKDLPNAKDVRALLLNLGVANMLFAAVSNLAKFIGGDDEDREKALAEMKKAMLGLNILYQIPLIGDAAETMVNAINGDPMPRTGTINPLLTVFYKAYKGIKEDDYLKVVQPIFEIAAGAQADPFIGLYKYFSTDNTKEETDAMYDMLGIAKSYRPEENTGGKILKEGPTEKELKELKEYDPDTYQFLYGEGTDYKIQKDEEKALKKEEKENKETFNNY